MVERYHNNSENVGKLVKVGLFIMKNRLHCVLAFYELSILLLFFDEN